MPRKEIATPKKTTVSPHTESVMMRPVTYTGPIMSVPSGSPSMPQVPTQQKSSFGQIIKEGFAFGIGSSIAQRIFGPSKQVVPQTPVSPEPQAPPKSIESEPTIPDSKTIKNMTDQLIYHQCILEGGTEETCKQYMV